MLSQCPRCHYPFDGLPEEYVCPECGLRYDEQSGVWNVGFFPVGWVAVWLSIGLAGTGIGLHAWPVGWTVCCVVVILTIPVVGALRSRRVGGTAAATGPDGLYLRTVYRAPRLIGWHEIARVKRRGNRVRVMPRRRFALAIDLSVRQAGPSHIGATPGDRACAAALLASAHYYMDAAAAASASEKGGPARPHPTVS